ncbi:TadE family protein [Zobellella iuensis]|uniref:Pilus assembly protein n=1 Tax=Zobellella iuensis TaxID=2803811 RepID=A0ABS1QUJ9_9GAMM|nr:TadE family protein [Zobellella iuensis]MBL1378441.1 pilus assembly protein [Zobellella iuensis]
MKRTAGTHIKGQVGTTTVEFAIVGAVVFLVLFAVMEVARLMYTWGLLNEVSRRGARLAAVCTVEEGVNGDVSNMVLAQIGGSLPGFAPANLELQYLGADSGTPLAAPAGADEDDIKYVRSRIVNYRYEMILPLTVDLSAWAPDFATTVRTESLGNVLVNGIIEKIPCGA